MLLQAFELDRLAVNAGRRISPPERPEASTPLGAEHIFAIGI